MLWLVDAAVGRNPLLKPAAVSFVSKRAPRSNELDMSLDERDMTHPKHDDTLRQCLAQGTGTAHVVWPYHRTFGVRVVQRL